MKNMPPSSIVPVQEALESFRLCNNHTQLNLAFRKILEEHLGTRLFGIFIRQNNFTAISESPHGWQSLGLETLQELISSHAEKGLIEVYSAEQKNWTSIPIARPASALLIVENEAKTEVKADSKADANTEAKNDCIADANSQLVQTLGNLWMARHELLDVKIKSQELSTELNRALHNLSVLRSVGQAVGEAHDLQHLLSLILRVAISTVSAERGFVMLEGEQAGYLELKVVHGLNNPDAERRINSGAIKSARIKKGEGVQGRVMETREPIILSGDSDEISGLSAVQGKVSSLMCVPLCMKDEAFGVIFITNKKSGKIFDNEDLNILCVLASHAAAVIDQARLLSIASTDELTGLYTRRYYLGRIGEEVKRARRYGRRLSLLIADIDHFKKVNDQYGHLSGDLVLRNVARILKSSVRTDVDFAVRLGGEEFLIVMPETDLPGATIVGERIRQTCEKEGVELERDTVRVTMSLGLACLPNHGTDIDTLFRLADEALYESKNSGRNRLSLPSDASIQRAFAAIHHPFSKQG